MSHQLGFSMIPLLFCCLYFNWSRQNKLFSIQFISKVQRLVSGNKRQHSCQQMTNLFAWSSRWDKDGPPPQKKYQPPSPFWVTSYKNIPFYIRLSWTIERAFNYKSCFINLLNDFNKSNFPNSWETKPMNSSFQKSKLNL